MKKILIALGAVIVVIIGIGIALFIFAGDAIKAAVERVGSDATQAKVTLQKVDLDMIQASGGMSGLIVGNPKGFKTPNAFELGNISLVLDKETIGKNPIVIRSVAITGPVVAYEKAGGSSNVEAIKANVDQYAKKFGGPGRGAEKEDGGGQKLIIEKLTITGGKVKLNAGILGDKTLDAPLPDLTLTDIGKDSGGASPAEVAQAVIARLTSGIQSINPEKMIGNASKMMEGTAKGATDAVKGASEGAGKAMEGAGDSVKDLFKK